jgi:hypothetical protein
MDGSQDGDREPHGIQLTDRAIRISQIAGETGLRCLIAERIVRTEGRPSKVCQCPAADVP